MEYPLNKVIVNIFPNPFTNSISLTGLEQEGIILYSITDVLGATILQGQKEIYGQEIVKIDNLDEIPEGIYILSISNNNGILKSIRIMK